MGIIKHSCLFSALLLLTSCAGPSSTSTAASKPGVRKAVKALPMPPVPPGLKIQRATTASARVTSVATATPAPGDLLSVKGFGSSGNESVQAVAVDRSGNVIVGGNGNPFLAKRTPSGEVAWTLNIGANVMGVAVDANDDILVTGNFLTFAGFPGRDFGGGPLHSAGGYDIFVAKYSSTGAHLWSKRFGGPTYIVDIPSETAYGIAVDTNDNSVVVTGIFDSTVDFGGGPLATTTGAADLFLAKFRSDGTHVWSRRGGASWGTAGKALAIDSQGSIFLTGYFSATMNFGGGPVTSTGQGLFIVKYSPTGAYIWLKHFGPHCQGQAIAVDRFGDVVVTGISSFALGQFNLGGQVLTNAGMEDIVLGKYSGQDGRHLWSKCFGGPSRDYGNGVSIATDGAITLTGRIMGPVDFGGGPLSAPLVRNALVASFAADGTHRWSKAFSSSGTPTWEEGRAVATDANGHSFVVGIFSHTVDFGGQTLTSVSGSQDVFLAEYSGTPPPPVVAGPRPVEIFDAGDTYGVVGIQTNNPGGTMQFKRADTIIGPWVFLGDPGWLAQGESAMVFIPKNWLPHNRLFVNVILSASPQPAAMTPAGIAVDSGKTVMRKGVRYRLINTGSTNVYKLKL